MVMRARQGVPPKGRKVFRHFRSAGYRPCGYPLIKCFAGNPDDLRQPVGDSGGISIVDADNRRRPCCLIGEDTPLGCDIPGQPAMPVQMIGEMFSRTAISGASDGVSSS